MPKSHWFLCVNLICTFNLIGPCNKHPNIQSHKATKIQRYIQPNHWHMSYFSIENSSITKSDFFCLWMWWFPTMFCHAGPSSLMFLQGVKFSWIVIHRSKFRRMDCGLNRSYCKKLIWRTTLWLTSQDCSLSNNV